LLSGRLLIAKEHHQLAGSIDRRDRGIEALRLTRADRAFRYRFRQAEGQVALGHQTAAVLRKQRAAEHRRRDAQFRPRHGILPRCESADQVYTRAVYSGTRGADWSAGESFSA